MAHREFVDADGVPWEAWEVIPSTAERRSASERRFGARDQRERRLQQQLRVKMHDGLVQGWLVFESPTEKRRLNPIPDGWAVLTDEQLGVLARTAEPAARPTPRPGG